MTATPTDRASLLRELVTLHAEIEHLQAALQAMTASREDLDYIAQEEHARIMQESAVELERIKKSSKESEEALREDLKRMEQVTRDNFEHHQGEIRYLRNLMAEERVELQTEIATLRSQIRLLEEEASKSASTHEQVVKDLRQAHSDEIRALRGQLESAQSSVSTERVDFQKELVSLRSQVSLLETEKSKNATNHDLLVKDLQRMHSDEIRILHAQLEAARDAVRDAENSAEDSRRASKAFFSYSLPQRSTEYVPSRIGDAVRVEFFGTPVASSSRALYTESFADVLTSSRSTPIPPQRSASPPHSSVSTHSYQSRPEDHSHENEQMLLEIARLRNSTQVAAAERALAAIVTTDDLVRKFAIRGGLRGLIYAGSSPNAVHGDNAALASLLSRILLVNEVATDFVRDQGLRVITRLACLAEPTTSLSAVRILIHLVNAFPAEVSQSVCRDLMKSLLLYIVPGEDSVLQDAMVSLLEAVLSRNDESREVFVRAGGAASIARLLQISSSSLSKSVLYGLQLVAACGTNTNTVSALCNAGCAEPIALGLSRTTLEPYISQFCNAAAILARNASGNKALSGSGTLVALLGIAAGEIGGGSVSLRRAATYAIQELAMNHEPTAAAIVDVSGLAVLGELLTAPIAITITSHAAAALHSCLHSSRFNLAASVTSRPPLRTLIRALLQLLRGEDIQTAYSAMGCLSLLASLPSARPYIRAEGGISLIVRDLRSSNTRMVAQTALCVMNCAADNECRFEMAELRVVGVLLKLLSSSQADSVMAAHLAGAIRNCSQNVDCCTQLVEADGIRELVNVMQQGASEACAHCIASAGNVSLHSDQGRSALRALGGLALLFKFLRSDNPAYILLSLIGLVNAAKNVENANELYRLGAVQHLISLMSHSSDEIRAAAAAAVGHCALHKIYRLNAHMILHDMCLAPNERVRMSAVVALSHCELHTGARADLSRAKLGYT